MDIPADHPLAALWAEEARLIAGINARGQRNMLLQSCDLVVIRSYESGVPVPTEWVAYRQALRDVPAQPGFPENITWPTKPE